MRLRMFQNETGRTDCKECGTGKSLYDDGLFESKHISPANCTGCITGRYNDEIELKNARHVHRILTSMKVARARLVQAVHRGSMFINQIVPIVQLDGILMEETEANVMNVK